MARHQLGGDGEPPAGRRCSVPRRRGRPASPAAVSEDDVRTSTAATLESLPSCWRVRVEWRQSGPKCGRDPLAVEVDQPSGPAADGATAKRLASLNGGRTVGGCQCGGAAPPTAALCAAVVGPVVGPLVGLVVGPLARPVVGPPVGPVVGPPARPVVGLLVGLLVGPPVGQVVGPPARPVVGPLVGLVVGPPMRPVVRLVMRLTGRPPPTA